MKRISEHVSYDESVKSDVAIKYSIVNKPNDQQLMAMSNIANNVFEPLRTELGNKPIGITSFFRSIQLNSKIGGALTSQHCSGEAIDIDADVYNNGITNSDIFFYIKDKLEFDQLIAEFPSKGIPSWVHVSYRDGNNRGNILVSIHRNGKIDYVPYTKGVVV
jgi:zinc D-Ala-D-Ala carboxypeptidase